MGINKLKKILGSRIFLIVSLVVLLFLMIGLGQGFLRRWQIQDEITQLGQEKERLEARHLELNNLVGYLKTNSFVEGQARNRLNLQKEGEKVVMLPYVFSTQTGIESAGQVSEIALEENFFLANIKNWWYYFIKP